MDTTLSATSTATDILLPTSTSLIDPAADGPVPAQNASPVVAFIIGLAIILLASVLNAAGLNLTKLDHVRTSAIPKASRRKDWLRPLWLLGMMLYILSQLIGSTLALDYMRAEYVAPLGSTSLVFNFLFARFLVGTPVTSTDIYGTIVVVVGVIGIVAFGSINSGLASETDVAHITYLWRRGGWLSFFFCMSIALLLLLLFTSSLDAVLSARSDMSSEPFAGMSSQRGNNRSGVGFIAKMRAAWAKAMVWIRESLELWTAPKDDKQIAWTLGIGWACCGGGLAGGCLVFAKATVKLITGSLSHMNPGNQFGHVSAIFTIVLLACTAVLQIICLNRGLKVYDSTLVVPVFYGVYTATGFLDSLIFNDEVDSYQSWTLFLIFVSILVLISGVVLLTHKKPAPSGAPRAATLGSLPTRKKAKSNRTSDGKTGDEDADEDQALRVQEEGDGTGTDEVLWEVGDASDDETEVLPRRDEAHQLVGKSIGLSGVGHGEEGLGLMTDGEHEHEHDANPRHGHSRRSTSSGHAPQSFLDEPEDFGEWAEGGIRR